jgi:hypothetical protein
MWRLNDTQTFIWDLSSRIISFQSSLGRDISDKMNENIKRGSGHVGLI